MGLIRLILRRKPTVSVKTPVVTTAKGLSATERPLHSVRRKFLFDGEEYSVRLSQSERNSVRIIPEEHLLMVGLSRMTHENFETVLQTWYRRQARARFESALLRWLPLMSQAGYPIDAPRLKIFKMRRAWARCYYTKGLITLNVHLMKTPPDCFDYIILHELCHFIEANHSARFRTLVTLIDPQWREHDALLRSFTAANRTKLWTF